MAEISIDQSKLPGVKEVCRDFAVLEDHTLAHSLQEQEIEHHLATNVQRNRLVQHDLQVAKQLQEEEDLKARAQIQKRYKDIERQDCEIAQEIQVKLVIEAEQRRRQEEKDEDIARILQQKELQEEKKSKKHYPEPQGHTAHEDSYYPENGDHLRGSSREQVSEYSRPRRARSGDRHARERREPQRASLALSDNATEREYPTAEESQSSPLLSKTRDDNQRSRERRKPGSRERPRRPPSLDLDRTADFEPWDRSSSLERKPLSCEKSRRPPSLDLDRPVECKAWDHSSSWERQERKPTSQERPPRPPSLDLGTEVGRATWEQKERRPLSQERPRRPPALQLDLETDQAAWGHSKSQQRRDRKPLSKERARRPPSLDLEAAQDHSSSWLSNPENQRSHRQDRMSPRGSCEVRFRDAEELHRQDHRRGEESDYKRAGHGPRTSPSPHAENWERDKDRHRDPGLKPRGTKEAVYAKPRVARRDLELYDAEIARKLQEEELLANQVDKRAAQVAQDEEIARLLMAEEKKAYKKTKDREKSSLEKKRQDQDWKRDTSESARPRSRDRLEPQRPKSDKPARPPPPSVTELDDFDHSRGFTSQPSSVRQFSKPESSPKGFHYKQ
ncbi:coiled-coil domain-containing protein 50 isoform X1 [Trachemys scripta elegans]|uniref:coiled-coil domain-containing protein 50 isoform X1 n=1 Tax=Trachemys scripta elegans TaxID=31138 RepID=UPI001554F4DD|nr:coiled-coil domain-containing protein 50 isoform X1 [Trachemys scripta elegans]